ncbi:protein outspread-like isoform X2 [Patiria miniata]|uniref:PH domain-containing protein n=1 Tax=Patiria miniata TaxID=46514 RepID=A0A914ALY1_PATMI|nr:protein outspread-like isoform X2 [Patiria miniata]
MLDGDSPSPSKRTIERRKHANNRRGRHTVTIDSSMHVIPSSDESETNKDTPTLKRSNSDPNLADSDDMLKRKQIAMTFPGLFHLKKGWLIKQGDGEQDWSKHWFVLCDNKLSYYKDSSDEDPNSLDGVIELAKCNEASETPVNRNYGFQIELDTGVIILAAMTSGIRNNWVGAINKAIKTAREDSAKKSSEPTSLLKENQPLVSRTNKPNSLPLSKSTSDVQPREEQSSPLQPARRSLNNVDLIPPSSRLTQTDSKSATQSPVELKPHLERRSTSPSQPTKTSPSEGLPPHSGKPEGRRSSVTKAPSSESRPRRGSVPKEGASSTGARRNSVTKDPGMSADGKQKSVTRDRSGSDLTKPKEKSKERRGRRGSRSEKRSQEDTAAAVTAALSKRTSNTDSKQSTTVRKSRSNSQPEEPVTPSSNSEQEISPRSRTDSNSKKQPATVDTTVMSLLEQEVDTLKAQLEQKQKDCARLQHQNVNLKAQLNSEQRDHKESFQDLENEQSGYMTQIEQMEKTNQKLQAELRQSKNATQQLQQQNQQLGSKFNAVELEAQGRDRELATLKARFEDIVRDLTVTRSNLKEERERSETLETELTDTWTKLRESGREGVDVDVIGRLSIKLDEARVRLEESESDAIEKEKKLEERFSLMQSQYHSENASLQGRLQAAMDETNKLQRRLTEKSEQVEKTEAAVQKAGQTDKPSSETNVGVAELEATVQKLKSELKAEVTAKSEVQRKYDDLVAQSAHQFLEGQGDMASTGSDDNAVRLETELDLAERELEKLKKHSASEKEKKILLEKAFQKEQALRKQLEERIGQSTQESGSSKVDIEQKNSEVASVRDELKKAKKEREAVNLVRKQLVTAVDSLNSQLAEKERKIETLSAEVETRGSQNSQLEQQLQASLSKGLNLQSRVENLEAELKQVSEKRETDASAQLGALQSEHRQLKRQIGTLEEQHALEMHNRQSELETAGDRINSLQDKVAELEIKLKTAMERAARIEDEAAASILDMQKEDELLRSKCERGEKEIKRLRGELHGAQDNYDELEFQFITQREDLKRMEHDRGKEIGQMGYRIQDLTNKLAAAERKTRNNGDLVLQEKSHREILEEMRRSHNQEIKALEEEKETELEEERKATSISITALHKAHKHELEQQRADMQQNVSNDVEVVMKRHREVITKMDQEWKIISDKFTHVCANNATLKKQVETLEKGLVETRREMESWKAQVRLLVGQKAEDMAALKEQRGGGAGNDGEEEEGGQDDWGVDGNDNEKNPLQVLLRFREAELQCINNEINQLTAALEEAEKQRTKAIEQNVFLEGQHQSQEEHIKQLMLALEELQHQVEIVRTSGEGQAAQDQIQEMSGAEGSSSQHNPPQGSGDAKQDVKLRSWLPFLKRERSDSAGKGSRRRTGSDGTQTAAKLKKGASTTE